MITCSDSDHNHGGDNMHDLWSSWSWWYRPCQGLWLRTTLEFPPLSQNHENHLHDHLQHYHTNAGVEEDSPSKPDGRGEVQGLLLLHLLGLHVVSLKKMSECIFPMSFVYLYVLVKRSLQWSCQWSLWISLHQVRLHYKRGKWLSHSPQRWASVHTRGFRRRAGSKSS